MSTPELYGIAAEFTTAEAVTAAARHIKNAGFRRFEAYTPMPVEALDELIAGKQVALPLLIFCFGCIGFLVGFFMQYYLAVVDYPIHVGGRPLNSWPAFGPITFEITVVFAVGGAFLAWFIFNRLPRLGTPLSAIPGFERATIDRYFLCVEASDPRFDRARLRWLFERCGAHRIAEVAA
ncbi:MAG TPA: DUF3341 domain-containing protein [Stellaceae bacterium]|nr:DUF3341 domain-containing protein [Stellaceae bacterium]